MATRPLGLNRSVSFILQSAETENGTPFAARISLNRLSAYLIGVTAFYLATILGTLLFFRELEINRKLRERVLRLETEHRLYQANPLPEVPAAAEPSEPPKEKPANAPAVAAVKTPVEKPAALSPSGEAFGRINDLRVDCAEGECTVKLGMLNSQPGTAVGRLLLVLETEVPRIGAANPQASKRTRFFLYPGNTARDSLDPNELSTLDQRPFRFTRALQTSTTFKTGKLLRPIAINAYIFSSDRTLLQHERKVVQMEE